jgi:hypothetical protein
MHFDCEFGCYAIVAREREQWLSGRLDGKHSASKTTNYDGIRCLAGTISYATKYQIVTTWANKYERLI